MILHEDIIINHERINDEQYLMILVVLEGKVQLSIQDNNYIIDGLGIILFNQFEDVQIQLFDDTKVDYIFIKSEVIRELVDDLNLLSLFYYRPKDYKYDIKIINKEEFIEIYHLLKKEYENNHHFSSIAFKGLFQYFMVLIYQSYEELYPILKHEELIIIDIHDYVITHILEDLSLIHLAKQFYLNPSTISRLFKKVMGYKLNDYLILTKISKAKRLLKETQLSVTEVCLACGFHNLNHFIRVFKKNANTTPVLYRNQIKNETDS